jgi:hypothetical protein
MNLSTDKFTLPINRSLSDIERILRNNTLEKEKLIMEHTSKCFIGFFAKHRFSLIAADNVKDVVCKVDGEFIVVSAETTQIEIQTTVHKAFVVLFMVFIAFVTSMLIYTFLTAPYIDSYIAPISMVILAIATFRVYIHLIYVKARKRVIRKIEELLA